jgi:putative hemolysin
MTIVHADTTVEEFFEIARASGYTRMPVFDREKQAFTGVVNVFYVLSRSSVDRKQTVGDMARPPLFIPETMAVDDILPRLRRFRQPLCLVRDERSEVTGLITTEDILEEIVGKL